MSMKGKREAPRGDFPEQQKKTETTPEYEIVSFGDDEADRLDTEQRLEERRRQRKLEAEASGETAETVEAAEEEEWENDYPTPPADKSAKMKKILVAVCVVLALVLVGLMAYKALFVRPDVDTPPVEEGEQQVEEEIDVGNGLQPVVAGKRKSEDYYTFLILGRDTGGGGNCDAMLLASYDMTNQKATVMSIPRDTMVNVPWDVKKINSVYNHFGGGDRGISKLKTEISQLVGFKPDYTMIVEWEAVGELVDAIGGVWFDVPYDMRYWDPYQDLEIVVDKGYQLLDGDKAMGVIRWRHNSDGKGYPDGDLGRIKTQQAFLKAVISQVLQVKNAVKLFEFAEIFQRNVATELSVQNLFWFAKGAVLGGLDLEGVEFVTMPSKAVLCWSRLVKNMQSYVTPRPSALLELVNTKLSPFEQTFTLSNLDLMSVNADGSISSTTGYVEDEPAALPPVKPDDEVEEIITDPNDPNYDPTKDPNSPEYIPPEETENPEGTDAPEDDGIGVIEPETPTDGEEEQPRDEELWTPPDEEIWTPPEEEQTGGEEATDDSAAGEPDYSTNGGEGFIDDGTGW